MLTCMYVMYASLSGRTGRLRRRNSKPLAWGVKRSSKLKNGGYRVWFDAEMPDTNYVVFVGPARDGMVNMMMSATRQYADVCVRDLTGAFVQPETVGIQVYRPD